MPAPTELRTENRELDAVNTEATQANLLIMRPPEAVVLAVQGKIWLVPGEAVMEMESSPRLSLPLGRQILSWQMDQITHLSFD